MSQSDALRQALAVSPDNIPLLLLFADACFNELSIDESRTAYEKILSIDPRHKEAQLGLIKTLQQQGKTSEAIVRLEAYTHSYPTDASGFILLSRLLMADGSRDQARRNYEHARTLPGFQQDTALEQDLYMDKKEERQRVVETSGGWQEERDGKGAAGEDEAVSFERPTIDFNEVGGMESVKEEIRMKILYPLKNPDLFRAYGKKVGGGVLLYGPPGCGKTLISRATAGEIKANFISIGIHEILNFYIGESEKSLNRVFEIARQNTPAILFFDEVDALAADRTDMRKSAGRTLINQFLAEMDGNVADNDGLLILGATNAPWHIDPAFRRPGRFDRILFVPPPDEPARASVIEVLARNKPVADLDINALAKKTRDFSGADLKAIFDITIERKLAQALKQGSVVPISTKDLLETAKTLKPTTKAWFDSAKNYALYSNQGGFYDDVLAFLGIKK